MTQTSLKKMMFEGFLIFFLAQLMTWLPLYHFPQQILVTLWSEFQLFKIAMIKYEMRLDN
jgi:hypothetical protein